MWREIESIISQNKNFLLTTHVNPDGDGVGSACALMELLLALGKKGRFICDNPIPDKLAFLDYHQLMSVFPDHIEEKTEVLIVLDTHKKERIGRLSQVAEDPHVKTIWIDHHPIVSKIPFLAVIDPHSCAVGAMVYQLFEDFKIPLNQRAASGIYTSIICDTGRFSYSSTSRAAHKIAEECIRMGVDPDVMYSRLFRHVSLSQMKVFASALQRMESYLENRVLIQQIYLDDWKSLGGHAFELEHMDLDYIHDFNKTIEDVDCTVLLRELPSKQVRVSIRCNTDMDVGQLLGSLGGGGHSRAAGVTWNGTVSEVKARILELIGSLETV